MKWGGNGEKIQKLAPLIEESLNFLQINEPPIRNHIQEWYSIVLRLWKSTLDDLNDWLKNKIAKHQHQIASLVHLIKPLGQVTEQLSKIEEKAVSNKT